MPECVPAVTAMVTAQAPRLFAAVVTKHDGATEIIGWGMQFSDKAYMVTVDGRNQYFLADARNALNYVRRVPGVTPEVVWVGQP